MSVAILEDYRINAKREFNVAAHVKFQNKEKGYAVLSVRVGKDAEGNWKYRDHFASAASFKGIDFQNLQDGTAVFFNIDKTSERTFGNHHAANVRIMSEEDKARYFPENTPF
tara:strand:- start:336 stop:671 length:336 start_codon:yes stop_codon:yes gene_type:complete